VRRAFGHPTAALVTHFLKLALLVGALGAAIGTGLGVWFAWAMVDVYRDFFDLPVLAFAPDPVAVLGGAAVSLGFAALGAVQAVRSVARLDPADGLRPAAPSEYGRTLFERVFPLWRRLGFAPRMILRHVTRTPLRALVTVGGVAFATAIVVFTTWIYDAWDAMVDVQFRLVERQDARVLATHGIGPDEAALLRDAWDALRGRRQRRSGEAALAPAAPPRYLLATGCDRPGARRGRGGDGASEPGRPARDALA